MGSGLSSTHQRSSSAASALPHHPPAPAPAPALVVAADGSLREFAPAPRPVSAADALAAATANNAGASARRFFLCSADALYFGADVPALGADEPLRAGQIYFVLPAAALARPLSSADMAALAVRASEALAARAAGHRGGRGRGFAKARVVPAPYADGDEEVNEKLNQRTLGGFETAALGPARRNAGAKYVAAAARPPVRRALSTIQEDAE